MWNRGPITLLLFDWNVIKLNQELHASFMKFRIFHAKMYVKCKLYVGKCLYEINILSYDYISLKDRINGSIIYLSILKSCVTFVIQLHSNRKIVARSAYRYLLKLKYLRIYNISKTYYKFLTESTYLRIYRYLIET